MAASAVIGLGDATGKSGRTKKAEAAACSDLARCAKCGRKRWWHFQAMSVRDDDGHVFVWKRVGK
jgi:hypothetical protein